MSDTADRSFWLCHECGAQMRPIRVDGSPHCASCNSEFIEILDSSVNPDPWHELPASPPVRPLGSPPIPGNRPSSTHNTGWPGYGQVQGQGQAQGGNDEGGGGLPGLLGGLIGSIFGGGGGSGSGDREDHDHARQSEVNATGPGSPGVSTGAGAGAGGLGRTYQFNFGGGSGSVTFGTFGGGGGGGVGGGRGGDGQIGMGPFGPFGGVPSRAVGGDQGGGLDAFFPGFPPPQRGPGGGGGGPGVHPGHAVPGDPNDIIRALMGLLADEGMMQGPQGRMDMGDYVASQHGFENVLETLMHAAGPQGPLPATDAVIEGLPRFKMDEEKIEKSTFKDCPVCKDDFVPDDEVMRVPCEHLFHVDCLQPWLKTNGSCPVCRFSLVPDQANRETRTDGNASDPSTGTGASAGAGAGAGPGTGNDGQNAATAGGNPFANILNRLWGQSGAAQAPPSDTTNTNCESNPVGPSQNSQGDPASSNSARAQRLNQQRQRQYSPPRSPPPGSLASLLGEGPAPSSSEGREYSPPAGAPPGYGADISTPTRSSGQEQQQQEVQEQVSGSGEGEGEGTLPNSIPEDYRARHRQREREQQQRQQQQQSQSDRDPHPYGDDLD